MRIKSTLLAGLVLAIGATVAIAQPVSERDAKRALFKGSKISVRVIEGVALDEASAAQVNALVAALKNPQLAAQFATYGYYGAIAIIPGTALSEKTMTISAGLHSPEAAVAAALAGCNALEGPACVAVATIVPKRYKPRSFTLNQAASVAFFDVFRGMDGPKYMAYSPTTKAFSSASGGGADAAAIERCNEAASVDGAQDCVLAITQD